MAEAEEEEYLWATKGEDSITELLLNWKEMTTW